MLVVWDGREGGGVLSACASWFPGEGGVSGFSGMVKDGRLVYHGVYGQDRKGERNHYDIYISDSGGKSHRDLGDFGFMAICIFVRDYTPVYVIVLKKVMQGFYEH